jgi:hypothetical protein
MDATEEESPCHKGDEVALELVADEKTEPSPEGERCSLSRPLEETETAI